jgi:non-homologous end joining protein Ku
VPRAIWSGAITFGLVNVPVKVYSATEDHDVSLHQVHAKDGGRIRYKRTCELDGEVLTLAESQGVNVLNSPLGAYEICAELSKVL